MVQVQERIYQVQAPFEGGGLVMLYVLRGSKLGVIDTGVGDAPARDLRPALQALGLGLHDIDVIVNTHGHFDHLGGNALLKREAPAARIHLHAADRPFAESHDYQRNFFLEFVRQFGRLDQVPAREAFVLRMAGDGDAGVDQVLADGDRVDLGSGLELTVVHTPGHTPGSVCLYWEAERLLFTGDAVQGRGSRNGGYPLYFDAAAYRRSIARIRELPVETMCLGHGFHSSLPLNTPVRRGLEVSRLIEDSAAVADAIGEAVRARVAHQPEAGALEIAQAVTIDLLARIPALLDPALRLPISGGPTLWAHIREARAVRV